MAGLTRNRLENLLGAGDDLGAYAVARKQKD
jgi:hypothetical protein